MYFTRIVCLRIYARVSCTHGHVDSCERAALKTIQLCRHHNRHSNPWVRTGVQLTSGLFRKEFLCFSTAVGFHNFNLRIFNLRVSNPNKLVVDVFFDTMSDFNVPGSRPNKNTMKFRKSTVSSSSSFFSEGQARGTGPDFPDLRPAHKHMHICMYVCVHIYIYIYIYIPDPTARYTMPREAVLLTLGYVC